MKIISWNVNGLRAIHKRGEFLPLVRKAAPDILCLQETKAREDQLPDELRNIDGYYSYFSSSKIKKGYSGVAIYGKEKPRKIEYGMSIKKFDDEGRMIAAYYDDFVLMNVYFPNAGMGPERLKYKLDFYDAFLKYVEKVRAARKNIIFCGDLNTAHKEIDLARPKENKQNTGFLPEERAWIDKVISRGYVDIFRRLHPEQKDIYTYWDLKTLARERNVGWRIDYFFITPELPPKVKSADIMTEIYGSDHCPVSLELK